MRILAVDRRLRFRLGLLVLALLIGAALPFASAQEKTFHQGPVRVKIADEKPVVFEDNTPVDPERRVQYSGNGMSLNVAVENTTLHLGNMAPLFKIDQNVLDGASMGFMRGGAMMPVQMEVMNEPLPRTPSGKERDGTRNVCRLGDIRITQTVEVVPTRAEKGQKRRRDAVLVRYTFENKDKVPHEIGMRFYMQVYLGNRLGGGFAAPNQPGKLLDGVELKDKTMPDYLELLQMQDLKNPGFVGRLTFNLGTAVEGPNRAVLTSRRGMANNWDIQAMPAMGSSAVAFYWDPRAIKPGAKRECAFALGKGVAGKLDGEGALKVDLAGSFEPNKLFTLDAFVNDPAPSQSLTLELPEGLERLEGKETQPVPAPDVNGTSLVQWKARVLRPGQYHLRVHSSGGMTQTKIVTVTKE